MNTPTTLFYIYTVMGWEAKPRSGRRPAIVEAEMADDVESDEDGGRLAEFWILAMTRTVLWLGWFVSSLYRALRPADEILILIDALLI